MKRIPQIAVLVIFSAFLFYSLQVNSPAPAAENGFHNHSIQAVFQHQITQIRVLPVNPVPFDDGKVLGNGQAVVLTQTLEHVFVVDENAVRPEAPFELTVVDRLGRIAEVGLELGPIPRIETKKVVVVGHDLQDKKDVEIIPQLFPLRFRCAPSEAGGVEAFKNPQYPLEVQIE